MLHLLRLNEIPIHNVHNHKVCSSMASVSDDYWARDMQADMKIAIDMLWKFKEELSKLHPNCSELIELMFRR